MNKHFQIIVRWKILVMCPRFDLIETKFFSSLTFQIWYLSSLPLTDIRILNRLCSIMSQRESMLNLYGLKRQKISWKASYLTRFTSCLLKSVRCRMKAMNLLRIKINCFYKLKNERKVGSIIIWPIKVELLFQTWVSALYYSYRRANP